MICAQRLFLPRRAMCALTLAGAPPSAQTALCGRPGTAFRVARPPARLGGGGLSGGGRTRLSSAHAQGGGWFGGGERCRDADFERAGVVPSQLDPLEFAKLAKERPPGGLPVMSVFLPPREQVAAVMAAELERFQRFKGAASSHQLVTTMRAPLTHGVAPPLSTLRPVTLREMARAINSIHVGRVLFVTSASPPARKAATFFMVVDERGDALLLHLYNFVSASEDPAAVFPPGTRLALLEPYMRHSGDSAEGMPMLRCDNPQAVLVFDSDAAWKAAQRGQAASLQSGDEAALLRRGAAAHAAGCVDEAHQLNRGARRAAPRSARALAAVAASAARVERYSDALAAATAWLELEPLSGPARFACADALLCLGRPDAALTMAQPLIGTTQLATAAEALVADALRAVREQRGEYDERAMAAESGVGGCAPLSRRHSDFESPQLELRPVPGKGRGMFAAADLPPGALLLA
jgi:hypothetical protein